MPVLVTGCAGFIGSHLVDALLAGGESVIGIDLPGASERPSLADAHGAPGFMLIEADLAEADLVPLVDSAEAIVHLAAEPGARASWGTRFPAHLRNTVQATQRLLEAAARRPERRLVVASSASVYGQAVALPTAEDAPCVPISPYGVAKHTVERLCAAYRIRHGLDVVVLRYFSVFGPRQRPDMALHRFCRAIAERRPLELHGTGAQTRDFTYVADAVAATLAARSAPVAGRTINVAGGTRTSLTEAIDALAELTAQRRLPVVHRPAAAGDVHDSAADLALARRLLGYAPKVDLRSGLRAQWEWTIERLGAGATVRRRAGLRRS